MLQVNRRRPRRHPQAGRRFGKLATLFFFDENGKHDLAANIETGVPADDLRAYDVAIHIQVVVGSQIVRRDARLDSRGEIVFPVLVEGSSGAAGIDDLLARGGETVERRLQHPGRFVGGDDALRRPAARRSAAAPSGAA